MRRVAVLAGSVAALALVCWPLAWPAGRDSFPLSTYPMFARDRPRVVELTTAVGVTAGGAVEFLSPETIAGTREPVQAFATATGDVAAGRADDLCREIAARLAGHEHVRTVEVVTARYDAVAWFDGDERPRARTVHARCPVDRVRP